MSDKDNKSDFVSPNIPGHPEGPTSIEGVEANDLPDGGRGSVNTDPGHELDRSLTTSTGEVQSDDPTLNEIGLTGHPDARRADEKSMQPERHQGDK